MTGIGNLTIKLCEYLTGGDSVDARELDEMTPPDGQGVRWLGAEAVRAKTRRLKREWPQVVASLLYALFNGCLGCAVYGPNSWYGVALCAWVAHAAALFYGDLRDEKSVRPTQLPPEGVQ